MIRKLSIVAGAALLALLVLSPVLDSLAPRLAAQSDYVVGQNRPPICNPNGLTPNLYYNVSTGHWTCTASAISFQGAAAGTTTANKSVIVDANKSIDVLGVRSSLVLGGTGVAGSALSDVYFTKEVTGLADATFTDTVTISVPNAAHAAVIPITLLSRLGAGGAVGADECAGTAYGQIVIERVAGAATVATATTLSNTGSSCSVGATTIATAYQVSSITGANSATQTFTIQIRVTKGAGSSTNHKVDVMLDLLNANASGITAS